MQLGMQKSKLFLAGPYAQVLLQEGLGRLDKRSQDLASDLKLAAWKGILESWVKLQCGVGNRWFSEHLYMGSIHSISKAVSAELSQGSRRKRMWRKLGAPKSKDPYLPSLFAFLICLL